MSQLEKKDIEHLAHLARIHLTDAEIESFERELPTILEFIAELQKVDTENVEAVTGGTERINSTRHDDHTIPPLGDPADLRQSFVAADPRGGLVVPKVFETRD
jgi:aspartyl/glutamyl-tRNA(Asn/Gln) amidotransferase C subunit